MLDANLLNAIPTNGRGAKFTTVEIMVPNDIQLKVNALTPRQMITVDGVYADLIYVGTKYIKNEPVQQVKGDSWYIENEFDISSLHIVVSEQLLEEVAKASPNMKDTFFIACLERAFEHLDELVTLA